MIIQFEKRPGRAERNALRASLAALFPKAGFRPVPGGLSVSGLSAEKAADAAPLIENLPGVADVVFSQAELCPLACGGRPVLRSPLDFKFNPVFIAGPCAVEDLDSYLASALALKAAGAHALRAALFKPRSSPYAFQGIGWPGLKIIARAARLTGLPLVTEATDTRQVSRLAEVCAVLQIGARNMRNYELLKEAGRSGRAVLLKRGMHASLREWLLSAEYLLKHGAKALLLCERGDSQAAGLDFRIMREAKKLTGLPVLADPSHISGDRRAAAALAKAALRAGADGLLIEASSRPLAARVDGRQTITIETFRDLTGK
jgi:3-deoxy-7-phosphoheptulonate synthase